MDMVNWSCRLDNLELRPQNVPRFLRKWFLKGTFAKIATKVEHFKHKEMNIQLKLNIQQKETK